jgi:regulator of protease activity HflC (stomatin/prohibitin superfamily)
MKQQNGFIDPVVALIAIGAVVIVGGLAFGLPQYGVYSKSMNGKAQLMEAEYTRQTAVLEAQAKLDSAEKLKQVRITEAQGIAEANRIIGASLKNNPEYLTFLQIQNIQEGAEKGNKTYFVAPNQAGVPTITHQANK